jgi:DNA polymerase III subunit gamma/tau
MTQALYRKWRPHLWDEVVGQDPIVQTLRNSIRLGRLGHAYLFSGPRGTGKTTTARLLAKAYNCLSEDLSSRPCDQCANCKAVNNSSFIDLIEIDAASNTSVEDVRKMREKIGLSPSQGKFKIYIIDEVHMLSTAAFNALLKTLEEPPAHSVFILATTEIHKIPATVLSRCQRFEFRRIPVNHIVVQLEKIVEKENLQVSNDALVLIARQATGSLRDAISLLDQLSSGGEAIDLQSAQDLLGTSTSQVVIDLSSAVIDKNATAGLEVLHQALDGGSDPRQLARQVVDHFRIMLLLCLGNADQVDLPAEQKKQIQPQCAKTDARSLVEYIRLFNNAATDARNAWQPSLSLEIALAQAVAFLPGTLVESASSQPVKPKPEFTPGQRPTQPIKPQPVNQPQASKLVAPESVTGNPSKPETEPANQQSGNPELILQQWDKVRAVVKRQRPQTEALLNSCKVRRIQDNSLVLGFDGELLKSKMESGDNLTATHAAIREVTGLDIQITCAIVNPKAASLPQDVGADPDGIVSAAVNAGGKIIHKE